MEVSKVSTKKKKGAIGTARVGIIDKQTGEVIDEGSLIYVPKKVRIRGFFMAMQDGFEHVARMKLKSEELNVLLLLMGRMDYENEIRLTQKEIGHVLTMKRQNVSRALKVLRESGVIAPTQYKTFSLSPDIGWKGKVSNLRKCEAELTRKQLVDSRHTQAI